MTKRMLLVATAVLAAAVATLAWTGAGSSLFALFQGGQAGARGAESAGPRAAGTDGRRDMPPATEPAATPRVAVTLDARRQQLIGVRTAQAQRVAVTPEIRAVGIVRYDETRQAEINVKVDGWIQHLQADYTGKSIRRGDPLFTLYSPELVATQNEYLLALRGRLQGESARMPEMREYADRLVQAARERLLRWDMTPEEIWQLEQEGSAQENVPFRSPVSGVIVEKTALEGMHVTAGQTLFRVADLSVVWVEADVYERDMAALRVGQRARVTLDAYPGEEFVGRATYIYPFVEEQTRTAKARFQFANPRGRLKPGMYANVLLTGTATQAITVPADAVLDSGTEQVVFVALGEGYFEPRRVKIGRRTGDAVEVGEGLKDGERVAIGATFFLDSESQLRAAVGMFEAPPAQTPAAGGSAPTERLDITFRAQPDPPRTGDNTLEVSVKDASGRPIAGADVTVTFFMAAMPTMNMPAMRNEAKLPHVGGGIYRGAGQVMMAGRWDVTVTVSRGGVRLGSRQLSLAAR